MERGKFIVIDGIDGSGKGTQAKLLVERLRKEGYKVETSDFPQYNKWSSEHVKRYLRGEFGTVEEVGPKKASAMYALDRQEASARMHRWLNEGKIIISNRYVSANKGHQLGKIKDPEERKDFLHWINDLEYKIMGIPIPDLTLFLNMRPDIGQKLVDKKEERAYIKGKKRDIHEDDINHLENAHRAYLFCLENDKTENWQQVICFENDNPRLESHIHQDIYTLVKDFLN